MATTNAIPPGYMFFNLETFMSYKGKEMVEDLLKKAANRNPDAFDMYIYNDFYSYAVLDLVDKTLTILHSKIVKKDWDEAYCVLEALTVFNDLESSWPMCNDGERIRITDKVYGASAVTVLRALKKEGRLDATHFPSLEILLRNVTEWGDTMKDLSCGSDYRLVCKAVGRRLLKDKSQADIALEKARVEEWIESLDADDQEYIRKKIAEAEAEAVAEDNAEKPWYSGGKASDEDDMNPDFVLSRVWKEYKGYLSTVPTKPLRGPGSWDISKWTHAQKKQFEFAGGSDEEDSD